LLVVSHDREFLDGLVTKVYEFRNHRVKQYIGGIYDFLGKRKIENIAEIERKGKLNINKSEVKEESKGKTDYFEKKELDKTIRKVNQQITQTEDKIAKLEEELASINIVLSDPVSLKEKNENLFIRHGEVEKLIEAEMQNWEVLNAELEKLREQRF